MAQKSAGAYKHAEVIVAFFVARHNRTASPPRQPRDQHRTFKEPIPTEEGVNRSLAYARGRGLFLSFRPHTQDDRRDVTSFSGALKKFT